MRRLLAGFMSLLATAALAQPDNMPTNGTELRSAQAERPKADNVPAGGCMPIGLTARGDLVFPMQCRELIERERGPIPEQKQQVSEPRLQQEPKATAADRDAAATGQAQAQTVQPQTAQTESVQTQIGVIRAGQIPERLRKKLSKAERRKKQGLPPEPAPQVTGSILRN
jgi:hypothetical protein